MKVGHIMLALPMLALVSSCTTLQGAQDIMSYKISLASSEQEDSTVTQVQNKVDVRGRRASLLMAFFGLDNKLPKVADRGVCKGAGGKDGMPVIFSHEIDVSTMQAGDFKVTTSSGKVGHVLCATLAPADDPGELRTALLAGEFGGPEDQPARVEIVGNILSIDRAVNFKGESIAVTRLEEGATIVFAESVPKERWDLGKAGTRLRWGGGTGCPLGTKNVVRVVWAGGVSKPGGGEADDKVREQYRVTVRMSDGVVSEVVPFALADLNDGDNNHLLCLHTEGTPESVSFPAGFLVDPRGDLNEDTMIAVTRTVD
jgi:hypothetical protein